MRKLLVLFLLTSFISFSQEEKRIALVIGNAEYTKGALKNPVNDAKLIAKTLDSLGFEILEYYNLKSQREFKNAIRKFGALKHEPWDMSHEQLTIHNRLIHKLLDSKISKFQSFKIRRFQDSKCQDSNL